MIKEGYPLVFISQKDFFRKESVTMMKSRFPYIDFTRGGKQKLPYQVKESTPAGRWYQENGHEVIAITDRQEGKRFDTATIKLKKPKGQSYTNKITLSAPVSEGLCLRRHDGEIQVCILLQTRTPYSVEVGGKTYARAFQEMVGGLVEKEETLEEAAVREIREETGYEVKKQDLHKLVVPFIHKHTSYSDETSLLFYAIVGDFVGQRLDENEAIQTKWYVLDSVEQEFEDYLDGRKRNFFGFDMSEMLMLALQRFFVKYHRGEIEI